MNLHPREQFRQLTANWTNPSWWRHVALPFTIRSLLIQPYYRHVAPVEGDDFLAEDWDNLIILDACRYDLFAALYDGPGTLEIRQSPGSNTPEFLQNTFDGRVLEDVVYVTANPQVNIHTDNPFHAVVNVWETHWDDELNTVTPGAMASATLEAYEAYPDKRLIAHFIQPHYPFIGSYARDTLDEQAGIELSRELATNEQRPTGHDHIWLRLRSGRVSESVVRRAYQENLQITLPHIYQLIDTFDEPTVVTSDHGNSFGTHATPFRIPVWGHPPGVRIPELVTVPWLFVSGSERKQIVTEPAADDESADRETIEDRLEHLGYVT